MLGRLWCLGLDGLCQAKLPLCLNICPFHAAYSTRAKNALINMCFIN